MAADAAESPRLVFVLPVYDDWQAFALLLGRIDGACTSAGVTAEIVAVDDGSTEPRPDLPARPGGAAVDVLTLRRNVGHQRAIALGLAYVHAERSCDAVVVMDTDGEDRPEDVPKLLERFRAAGGREVVFAKRHKRLESLAFRACYRAYQVLHRVLTGIAVEVGNFSVVPASRLGALVAMPELWNHYAAAVFKSKLPFSSVPIDRGARLAGESKMSFVALAVHGLSAISVFSEIVAVRVLLATLAALGLTAVAFVLVAARIESPLGLAVGVLLLLILGVQLLGVVASFVFFVLKARSDLGFLPVRDFRWFVAGVERLSGAPATPVR